ncbi:hypothetical protein [Longimycelium tulufanense]|uniref:hypothetical protein n=1 Tax=Longimycelium tulufanense TaxID=907463 RepID=UPI0016695851|nr:hypothetical protein [Longimycelium tulufanense]
MTLAAVMAVGGLLVAEPAPARAAPPNLGDFQLKPGPHAEDLPGRALRLDEQLPKLGVQNILEDANRIATESASSDTCNHGATNSLKHHGISYCFDDADDGWQYPEKVEWYPQGVTTVADAQADQLWGSKRAILITWYNKDVEQVKGVRVTFLDPDSLRYRHVLLAYPFTNDSGNATYMSLRTTQTAAGTSLHAGGIAWYGRYLYVADTAKGIRVFDTRYIFDLAAAENGDTKDKTQIGRQQGTFYGHGYRFVMPQVYNWVNTNTRQKCTGEGGSSFSFVGLDRSGIDHLTTGEYCNRGDVGDDPVRWGRVARWPLDGSSGRPKLTDGLWKADAAYRLPVPNVQGALSYNDKWYISRSRGDRENGLLYVTKKITSTTGTLEIESAHRADIGVEDLSHWPKSDGRPGRIWTVTEHPGKRMIYACDIEFLNDIDRDTEICGLWRNPPE